MSGAQPQLRAGWRRCRKQLQLRLGGLWLPTRPAQITRLAGQERREQRCVLRSPGPGALRANRPPPPISTGKAAIWQLHLPWRKARQSWKSQEFLDLFVRPRKMSGSLPAMLPSSVVDGHKAVALSWWPHICPVATGCGGPCPPYTPGLDRFRVVRQRERSTRSFSLAEPNEHPDYQIIIIPSSEVTSVMLGKNPF